MLGEAFARLGWTVEDDKGGLLAVQGGLSKEHRHNLGRQW